MKYHVKLTGLLGTGLISLACSNQDYTGVSLEGVHVEYLSHNQIYDSELFDNKLNLLVSPVSFSKDSLEISRLPEYIHISYITDKEEILSPLLKNPHRVFRCENYSEKNQAKLVEECRHKEILDMRPNKSREVWDAHYVILKP